MLTGVGPSEETTPLGTSLRVPSNPILRTDTWLLPASTASRKRPSRLTWIAPWEASPAPVPAPPAVNGEPGERCERPVQVAVEPADGVRPRRVVVEVDVPDHRGEVAWAGAGDGGCIGRASSQRP